MNPLFPVQAPHKVTTLYDVSAHPGIDIAPLPAGRTGVECLAPENAFVVNSGFVKALEGHFVILRGDSGMYYYFGHFEKRLVSSAQRVSRGQAIGILGMTGLATGIHTHHEVRFQAGSGRTVDPSKYYEDKGEDMEPNVTDGEARQLLHDYGVTLQYGNKPDRQPTREEIENLTSRTYRDAVAQLRKYAPHDEMVRKFKFYGDDVEREFNRGLEKGRADSGGEFEPAGTIFGKEVYKKKEN